MDCVHRPNKRFTYRDAAAPLGREGQEWCDECDQPVPPDHDARMKRLATAIEQEDGGAEIIPIEALRARRQRQWELEERDYIYAARDVAARAIKENTVSGYEDAADFLTELYDDCCAHLEIETLGNDMRERTHALRVKRRQNADDTRRQRGDLDHDGLLQALIASLDR